MNPPTAFRQRRLCLAALLLPLAGCATPGAEQLSIDLIGAAVAGAVVTGERLTLTLRIQNRGASAIAIDGLAFRVEVDGTPVATVVSDSPFVVPRHGETARDVDAVITPPGLLWQVFANRRQTAREAQPLIRYRVTGMAHRAGRRYTPDPGLDMPFDGTAELPLPAATGPGR